MSQSRRLAAIMFTDIVGYTSLMNRDEEGAMALLATNRSIHKKLIGEYNGEFLKEMGDGIMASFPSSSDALSCAVSIQRVCAENRIHLRIGINQGEITFQDGDVFGDGVNIAAHIESLGVPDSILLSKATNRQIKNKPQFETCLLGNFNFKNTQELTEVYALVGEGLSIPTKADLAGKFTKSGVGNGLTATRLAVMGLLIALVALLAYSAFFQERSDPDQAASRPYKIKENSIAVLPFLNLSGKPDQDYFSDGMMEEVLNRLFQIEELTVISRTSSMKYKNTELSASEIARELGVAHILEGSVRTDQGNVRINVKLVDGRTDVQKWSKTYDRELEDIFTLQSDIAREVASQLQVHINEKVQSRIASSTTEDPEVWKLFMRAKYSAANLNDIERADELLGEAIAIDPNFAPAYAERGFLWLSRGSYEGDLGPEEILGHVYDNLNKAKTLDPNYPVTHVYLALVNLWFKWDFEGAEKEWDAFYRLSPSNQSNDPGYVDFLNAAGRLDEAVAVSNRILRNDASSSASWSTTGLSFYFAGQPEKAVKHYEEALELFPIPSIISDAARTFVFTGNYERAIQILSDETSDPSQASSRSLGNLAISYYHTGEKEKATTLLDILKQRTGGSPAGSPAYYTAMILAQMNEKDAAFDYLEKAYQSREVEMFWLNVEPPFAPLKKDPRWEELVKKVGFI